jgi:hypothetical protein
MLLSKKILFIFSLSSLHHENNIFVSFSKYKIIIWLCFSDQKICVASFLMVLDCSVENKAHNVLQICGPPSLFPFTFPLSLSHSVPEQQGGTEHSKQGTCSPDGTAW